MLSQLDRHEDALQHVMLSVILIQDEFLQISLPYLIENEGNDDEGEGKLNTDDHAESRHPFHVLVEYLFGGEGNIGDKCVYSQNCHH